MMKRTLALTLAGALFAGCSGNTRLLPVAPGSAPAASAARAFDAAPDGRTIETFVRMRIPRRSERRPELRPSTISPSTQSVSIAVNTAKAQIFNATPSSPGCTVGSLGTTCTFGVHAMAGTDTFTVTTYSGLNATGNALDRGIKALVPIAKGKANNVAVTLGPVVTNVANSGPGSLRFAVASANAGDTILFLLPKGSIITLATPIILTGTLAIAGPGAPDLTISGGTAHQLFEVAGTAAISGLSLAHARAAVTDSPGGAIQNLGALTLANDAFGANTSYVAVRKLPGKHPGLRTHGLHPHCSTIYREGGAIFNAGVLIMSNTTFSGNVVRSSAPGCIEGEGGAIYNDVTGTLSSTHDTYTGNAGQLGGAAYNAGIGGVTFTGDTFTGNYGCTAANGCPTIGCNATSCTSYAIGEGGAIYDNGVGITVAGSTFTGNYAGGKTNGAQGEGGAIYLNSPLATITGSTFTGNLAGGGIYSCSAGAGGAIFASNSVEVDSSTFKSNAATGDNSSTGGAIEGAVNVTGTGDTFTGNTAAGTGGNCTTSGVGGGGAVVAAGAATFTSSTFSGNTVTGAETAAGAGFASTTATIANCTFTSNSALATGAGGASSATATGGAIEAASLAKVSGSTFTSNSVTVESPVAMQSAGGAIILGSGSLFSTNNTFTSNSANLKAGSNSAGGGAVAMVSGTFYSTGDKFTSNTITSSAQAGGGAVIAASGVFMSNATFTANKATGPEALGGAMVLGAGGILKHVVMTGNSAIATVIGGGGALLDGGGATISDSRFSQNTASMQGGAIDSASSAETITDSTIVNNVVTNAKGGSQGGGGIFATSGVVLSQVTVAGNTLTVSGPGPAGGAGLLTAGGLIVGSTISGNKLLGTAGGSSGGGGILLAGALVADNSTISGNSSSLDGGGIENLGSSGNVFSNDTLYENTAHGKGGNLYNYTSAALTLTNSVIGGGLAAVGHDIDNAGTITSGGYNIVATAPAGTALTGTLTGNLTADPKLLALSNNGGPSFTNADTATSPGKGHIPFASSSCGSVSIAQDQRGFTRGAGGRCDSGAYEYAGVATAISHKPLPKPAWLRRSQLGAGVAFPHLVPVKFPFAI